MTKTIQLNPAFLASSTKNADRGTRKVKEKKEKPTTLVQPNKMRNDLLKKIKEYQSKSDGNNDNSKNEVNQDILEFTDEFNKSLHFLQDLTNKKNDIYKPSKTRKNPKSYEVDINLPDEMKSDVGAPYTASLATAPAPTASLATASLSTSPASLSTATASLATAPAASLATASLATASLATASLVPDTLAPASQFKNPTYSSIKNGSKPTYRELNNMNKPMIVIEDKPLVVETETSKLLEKIKSEYKKNNANANANANTNANTQDYISPLDIPISQPISSNVHSPFPIKQKKIKRTTRTCKYRLGKLGNKVSVLVKDYKTRKNIQNECYKLEKTKISDIKNFLRKKNLLKIGSVADDNLLREIFEQSVLAGDVQNSNKETLIHNFLAKV